MPQRKFRFGGSEACPPAGAGGPFQEQRSQDASGRQSLVRLVDAELLYQRGLPPQAQADALLTLATEQGFPLYIGHGTYLRGWTLAM